MIRSAAIAIAVLVSLPAAQAATQPQLDTLRAKSLAYLVAQQKGDGSWRDPSGNGIQATASVIEALAQSGIKTGYVPGAAISWRSQRLTAPLRSATAPALHRRWE